MTFIFSLRASLFPALAAVAVAGCAPSAPSTPPAPAAARSVTPAVSNSLAHARVARSAYEALRPPLYNGSGSKEDAFAFLNTEIVSWARESIPLWRRVVRDYGDAARDASDHAAKLMALGELVDAAIAARKRFVDAGSAAMPSAWRSEAEAELRDMFLAALEVATKGLTDPVAKQCLELTAGPEDAGPLRTRCEDLAHNESSAKRPPRPPQHWAPVSPWVSTSVIAPCAFAGSVNIGPVTLYGSPLGDDVVAKVESDRNLELERLEPPAAPSGRAHVVLRAPIHGEAWMDASARLFTLPHKIEVVPGHIWFDEGTRAVASVEKGALVLRPDPGAKVVTVRADVAERVVCSAAHLAARASWTPAGAGRAPPQAFVAVPAHDVPISAAPSGPSVAVLHGELVLGLVEIQGKWAHVRGNGSPVGIDGWISTSSIEEADGGGVIAVFNASDGAPRRAKAGATVTLRTSPGDPSGRWTLAPDAAVFMLRVDGASCSVRIPGFDSIASDGNFVTECGGLEPVELQEVH
jgi:hypothetical protein